MTPPWVSTPSDSGVTSRSTTSLTSPPSTPPWMAAPIATTSSGFTPLCGVLAEELLDRAPGPSACASVRRRARPRRCRPRRRPASFMACWHGGMVRWMRSATSCSSLARVRGSTRCLGPLASAVMKGRLISVCTRRAQLDLGLLRRLLQPLQRHAVLAQVDALLPLELVGDPVDDALVEVVATEVGVAVGGLDLEHALADLEDRDVERAAAEVVDGDLLVRLLVEPVGQRRPRWAR